MVCVCVCVRVCVRLCVCVCVCMAYRIVFNAALSCLLTWNPDWRRQSANSISSLVAHYTDVFLQHHHQHVSMCGQQQKSLRQVGFKNNCVQQNWFFLFLSTGYSERDCSDPLIIMPIWFIYLRYCSGLLFFFCCTTALMAGGQYLNTPHSQPFTRFDAQSWMNEPARSSVRQNSSYFN